jgi:hypothetical protein
MSTESWLFLFAAIGALGGLATVLNLLGVRMPLARLAHWGMPSIGRAMTLCTVSLLLSVVGFYGSLRGSGAKRIGALLYITDAVPTDLEQPFVAGRATKFNMSVRNAGPQPNSEDVAWEATLILLSVPVSSQDEQRRYGEFISSARPSAEGDLPITRIVYRTFSTRMLTEQDVRDVKEGRLLLYIFGVVTYKDTEGKHELQYCSFLQPPGDRSIWKACPGVPTRVR